MTTKFKSTLEQLLLEGAKEAALSAYSPYSGIRVGATLFAGYEFHQYGHPEDKVSVGKTVSGCNVENASYGLTICAERAAIFEAVRRKTFIQGGSFDSIAIVVDSDKPFMPCGACLQVMSEIARVYNSNPKIITSIFDFSEIERTTLKDLLPRPLDLG